MVRLRQKISNGSETGFTLVEVAIVLVIVALLIAGFLKGQQMIHSSRVKSIADTSAGIRTAYLGFVDRYNKVPGDWLAAEATTGVGVTINNPTGSVTTSNNGRLDNPSGANAYAEPNATWEQLSKSNFIGGSFPGTNTVPTTNNGLTPLNVYGAPIIIGTTSEYLDSNSPAPAQLHVYVGRLVPVSAMRELDVKVDDGLPQTGTLRATVATATIFTGGTSGWGGRDASCVDSESPPNWDVAADSSDCNAVLMF